MIVNLKIPDAVYEQYKKYSSTDPEKAMATQLMKFVELDPQTRFILIPQKERQALELLLEKHLENATELVGAVQAALMVRMDGVEIPVSPDVLNVLRQQAAFEGMEEKDYAKMKLAEGVHVAAQGYV